MRSISTPEQSSPIEVVGACLLVGNFSQGTAVPQGLLHEGNSVAVYFQDQVLRQSLPLTRSLDTF